MEIKQLMSEMSLLKERFQYYQNCQEIAKRYYNSWDPNDGLTKYQHELKYMNEIIDNRAMLYALERDIKECRKKIKQANRKQNKNYEKGKN